MQSYYIYILSSINKNLYIGVTNNLEKRIYQHKNGLLPGFTSKYHINKLVYFEEFNNINDAIANEKKLKNWKRQWKINLISEKNPNFHDLSEKDPETSSGGQYT